MIKRVGFLIVAVCCFVSFSASGMSSSSYQINADSINFSGTDDSSSGSYKLHDTAGEVGTGDSSSDSYNLRAGYQAMTMDYQISISCTDTVNMGTITGTGQSDLGSNEASCTVITDSPTGYNLTFTSATTYLENVNSDTVNAYTPVSSGDPEYWNIDAVASEWGARLKKTGSSTYSTSKWGAASATENYADGDVYWHNVTNEGAFTVASRATETSAQGDTEIIQFGAEVGSNKFQPTGTYDVDVTITAVAL